MTLTLSEDWRAIVAEVVASRRGADLSDLHNNMPHLYEERLIDISDLAERLGDALGGWAPEAQATCKVDGVWRAIPWSSTRHNLVTRSDLLTEVGAPQIETYDDLLQAATLLFEAGAPPVAFTMSPVGLIDAAAFAYSLLWSFGGQELDENGSVALDSPETRAAVDYFAELAAVSDPRAFDFDHPDNNAAFLNGEISITQNPSSIYIRARELELPIADSIGHPPLPFGPAGQAHLPELNTIGVYRHSTDPDAASDFVEYVLRRENLVARAQASSAFHAPLAAGFGEDPEMPWATDPQLAGFAPGSSEGRTPGWPHPPNREAGLVYDNATIINMFRAAGTGEMSTPEAVRTATEALRRVYET